MTTCPSARALLLVALLAATSPLPAQNPPPVAQPITLNFANARLADVVQSLATTLGLNVVLTDVPDKRITFSTARPVRPTDLGAVLESILESHNLVLVQKGPVAQVFPADKAPPTGAIQFGTTMAEPPPLGLVTQLVPLVSIRADEGAAALRPLASPTARIEPVPRSNALLITDRGVNVARYLELLRRLDETPAGEAGLRTYVVPLKYADAEELARALAQLFGVTVGGGRGRSVGDRALSRSLDVFRQREADVFQSRRDIPLAILPAAPLGGTPRDTTTAPAAPGTSPAATGVLVGQTTVVADPASNALIIRTVPPNFPLLRETIEALDVRPPQVLFEVTVAEITLGRTSQFGIDWATVAGGVVRGVQFGAPVLGDTLTPESGLAVRLVNLRDINVRAVLRALATTTTVNVLSTPELLAVNNREARIVVGSKVPFVASSLVSLNTAIDRSVQYQDVGTTLTIVPTINQDGYVSVQILQEVSQLTATTLEFALGAPVISTREASTRAIVRDGQTVVIGGLIGTDRTITDSGIPFLKDIPILGYLFKRRTVDRTRSELAIFVTPFIVRSDTDADTIRERVRGRMHERAPGLLDSIPNNAPARRPIPPRP